VGGAISRKISDSESLGLTLYYTARSYDRSLNDRSFPSTSEAILFNSEKSLAENAVVAILGYRKMLSDKWAFGASLRLPSTAIKGQGSYYESNVATNPYSATSKDLPDEQTNVHVPGKLTLGVAYKDADELALAADLSAYEALEYDDFDDPSVATHSIYQHIWNLSLGAEKKVFSWLKVRAGIFTNFSAHPDPDETKWTSQPDKVDQLGFSTNFAFISGDKIEYTFGGYYTGGRGRSLQQIDQTNQVIVVTQHVFTMLVGTAFSF